MRRTLYTTALFVTLGAITTIAVAWICAIFINPARVDVAVESSKTSTTSLEVTQWRAPGALVIHAIRAHGQFDDRTIRLFGGGQPSRLMPKWSRLSIPSDAFLGRTAETPNTLIIENRTVDARGWPMVSMWWRPQLFIGTGKQVMHVSPEEGGFSTPLDASPWPWKRALPLRIILTGFLVDTLLYAFIICLIARGPFILRRRIRLIRGQCPHCGYPAAASLECTECGCQIGSIASARASRLTKR